MENNNTTIKNVTMELEHSYVAQIEASKGCHNEMDRTAESYTAFMKARGASIIRCEEHLDVYNTRYAENHIDRLDRALTKSNLLPQMKGKNLVLVDYACGQGLGSRHILDTLFLNDLMPATIKLLLIEPSDVALKAAMEGHKKASHTRNIEVEIVYENIELNEWSAATNLKGMIDKDSIMLHTFCNILDLDETVVSGAKLAEEILDLDFQLPMHILVSQSHTTRDSWRNLLVALPEQDRMRKTILNSYHWHEGAHCRVQNDFGGFYTTIEKQ